MVPVHRSPADEVSPLCASQAGHDVEVNVWNSAMRAAVKAHAHPAVLDDLFEDMLLAGVLAGAYMELYSKLNCNNQV